MMISQFLRSITDPSLGLPLRTIDFPGTIRSISKIGSNKKQKRIRSLLALTVALGVSGQAVAQRELTDIPVPNASEELATFQMGDGWTAELFAGDASRLAKPIHMNWDNHGRLWVASSETYPQIVPANQRMTRSSFWRTRTEMERPTRQPSLPMVFSFLPVYFRAMMAPW